MNFIWDPAKAAANLKKHGVAFEDACSVFLDTLSVTDADPDHSVGEERCLTFEYFSAGQLLMMSHTDQSDTIRVIGAHPCTPAERKLYEKK